MFNEEKILHLLSEIEADERLNMKPASVKINAPLALIQLSLEAQSDVLRTILQLPMCKHNKETGKWEA